MPSSELPTHPTPSTESVRTFERYREIIPDYEGFLEASRQPLPAHIRVNTLKIGVEEARELMAERGYELEPVKGIEEAFRLHQPKRPGSTLEFFLGYYHIQGLTSMFPAKILDAQPGEIVLDLCAAPGGKATHLAQMMKNRGLVVANDTTIDRIAILRSHIDRLGTTSLLVSRYDGRIFPTRILFDRVLLDPPCSGEGTYRFGRTSPLSTDPGVVRRLAGLQQRLLRRALDLLRPGGTLVYSTCTYAPEENEEVIHPFVTNGEVEVLSIDIPFPHSPGLTSWGEKIFHTDLAKALRIYPNQVDSWGFFIAKLRKPR
jgi:NOL1/NOP2/sun family putative RNA methylase